MKGEESSRGFLFLKIALMTKITALGRTQSVQHIRLFVSSRYAVILLIKVWMRGDLLGLPSFFTRHNNIENYCNKENVNNSIFMLLSKGCENY